MDTSPRRVLVCPRRLRNLTALLVRNFIYTDIYIYVNIQIYVDRQLELLNSVSTVYGSLGSVGLKVPCAPK